MKWYGSVYKIKLVGNLIFDSVFVTNKFCIGESNGCVDFYQSVGGIGNLARYIRCNGDFEIKINSSVGDDVNGNDIWNIFRRLRCDVGSLNVIPSGKTSKASIICKVSGEKTSIVDWQSCRFMSNFDFSESDWTHFSYIDTLDNLTEEVIKEFSEKGGILSGDLCLNSYDENTHNRMSKILKYFDYIFISDSEYFLFPDIINICKGWVILHDADKITASKKESSVTVKVNKTNGVNVLGAGDIFASNMILNILDTNESQGFDEMKAIIEKSRDSTSKFLRRKIYE